MNAARVGQVFVIEDSNGTLLTNNAANPINYVLAYKYFQQSCGDHYDFVAMVPDTASGMPIVNSYAIPVFNDVKGIHYKGIKYNNRATYSTTRLQGIQVLYPDKVNTRQMRLHELGHHWLAYVVFRTGPQSSDQNDLAVDKIHWAEPFNSDFSPMSQNRNYWQENSDGSFSECNTLDDQFAYCDLDLYLMGMLASSEIQGFYYIDGLTRAHTPTDNTRCTGKRVDLTVKNIVWSLGQRQPDAANSPRTFRQAFVVLTKQLDAGKTLAANVDGYRKTHTTEYRIATRSRSVLDTYLYTDAYDGIYIQDNASDTGTEPSTGVTSDSPDIWVRNVDDGITTHQDPIRGRDNYVYVRVRNNGTQPSGEITVNVFQADWPGTDFLYPQDWIWDDDHLIGSNPIPPPSVAAGGDVVVSFKWNQNQIALAAGWQPSLLAEILPINPTKLNLRTVSDDRRIAQKNITIVDPTPP